MYNIYMDTIILAFLLAAVFIMTMLFLAFTIIGWALEKSEKDNLEKESINNSKR